MNLFCMMCSREVFDRYEVEADGEQWVYCRGCDCWTSHPPDADDQPPTKEAMSQDAGPECGVYHGMFVRVGVGTDSGTVRDVLVNDEYKTALYGGDRGRELVIDVGAHIGSFAKLWHAKNPEAVIVCVEVNPANIPVLTKNVGDFATVICAAVTYEPGELYMLDGIAAGTDAGNSSIVVDEVQAVRFKNSGIDKVSGDFVVSENLVTKITLEEILKSTGFDRIGVLKMDCEGSEFSILCKSAALRQTKTIFGEWHDRPKFDWIFHTYLAGRFNYGLMGESLHGGGVFHMENREPFRPVAASELMPPETPVHNAYYEHRAAKPKILRVVTHQGIGDVLWVFTKLVGLLAKERAAGAEIVLSRVLPDSDPMIALRAAEFIGRFNFVTGVSTMDKTIVEEPQLDADGQWITAPSQPGWWNYDWMMQANAHLEHGKRLEDWLPEIPIDWNVMDRFRRDFDEIEFAKQIRSDGPYLCVYAGSTVNNTLEGHNRGTRWTPWHWAELLKRLQPCRIVAIGAGYDADYWTNHVWPKVGLPAVNLVGKTNIGRTIEVIRHSGGLVAFQSGLGCVSGLLGVPTCMWWRKKGDSINAQHYISYDEEENGAFVPKEMTESGLYIPAIYPGPEGFTEGHPWTPERIAEKMLKHWPMFKGR